MATNTIDAALDFMPEAKAGKFDEILKGLKRLADGLSDGRAAQDDYKRLIAQGTNPSEAARLVFERHFNS